MTSFMEIMKYSNNTTTFMQYYMQIQQQNDKLDIQQINYNLHKFTIPINYVECHVTAIGV